MSYNKELGMYEGYIYCIENIYNGKKYIGQTLRTINDRWEQHVKDAVREADTYYFHRAIRLYGKESFKVEQVELLCDDNIDGLKNKLNDRERYYIYLFNTYGNSGYNGTSGGEGRCIRPIDHYSLDGKYICQYDSVTSASKETGLSMSFITNNCIGNALGTSCGFFRYAGEPLSKYKTIYRYNGAIKINKFNLDGELVCSYLSSTEIQKEYGVTKRVALNWRNNHTLIDNKFVLFLETEDFDFSKITIPFASKIDVFDLDMNYIRTFRNQSEAARVLHLDNSSISKCCLGKLSHVKDYIFRKAQWNI